MRIMTRIVEKSFVKDVLPILIAGIFIVSSACKNEDPVPENIPELITKVILKFSPSGGASQVTVTATDPDGGGVQDIKVDGPINLLRDSQYTMSIELINELYLPGDENYNITDAVEKEGQEHQFFFSFSEGVFASPVGSGNIIDQVTATAGGINYLDADSDGLPIGINTSWTTANNSSSNKTFRLVLKHQPDLKSTTSTSLDGESDVDITFTVNVN